MLTPVLEKIAQLVDKFRQQRVTPAESCRFEQQLQEEVRELARRVTQ